MKKSIKNLISNINAAQNGIVEGGFGSIKGGVSAFNVAINSDTCNNDKCSGTNSGVCKNMVDCSSSTNSSTNCTNVSTCAF